MKIILYYILAVYVYIYIHRLKKLLLIYFFYVPVLCFKIKAHWNSCLNKIKLGMCFFSIFSASHCSPWCSRWISHVLFPPCFFFFSLFGSVSSGSRHVNFVNVFVDFSCRGRFVFLGVSFDLYNLPHLKKVKCKAMEHVYLKDTLLLFLQLL